MKRRARVFPDHACPRCMAMTTAKDYCAHCVRVLRQPPFATRASLPPDRWEYRAGGKSL